MDWNIAVGDSAGLKKLHRSAERYGGGAGLHTVQLGSSEFDRDHNQHKAGNQLGDLGFGDGDNPTVKGSAYFRMLQPAAYPLLKGVMRKIEGMTMKFEIRLATTLTLLFGLILFANSAAAGAERLSAGLSSLSDNPDLQDSLVKVLVFLDNSSLQSQVRQMAAAPELSRPARLKSVVSRLMAYRSEATDRVEHFLMARSSTAVKRHWISPAFTATVPVSQLTALGEMDGVAEVSEDFPVEIEAPMATSTAPSLVSTSVSNELGMLRVPEVWQMGLNGSGSIVCNFDTGVDGLHPALSSKWRGNHTSWRAAWFSPMQQTSAPADKTGHGSHTMGTMIGSTAADSFGVAPGAEWIAAGVVDQGADLTTTFSHILAAFEWALNPDGDTLTTDDVPDVILNSWGVPTVQPSAIPPCSTLFWQAIDNVEAAGVVVVFAAGNEGRLGPSTVRNPANRASTPYNAFSVGAVDGASVIADFSGRGPSSCDPNQIKPEVVAPGVSIRSSTKGGGYTYMTGTSMAAPYIAGLVALCRQYNSEATPEQIKYAIMMSAQDLGTTGEDNDYGWGLPDAVKMLTYLPTPSNHDYTIVRKAIVGDGIARPGKTVSLQIMLADTTANQGQLRGTIRTMSPEYVTVSSAQSTFDFGDGGTTATCATPFSFDLSAQASNGTTIWFRLQLQSSIGAPIDSLIFGIFVGYPPIGTVADVATGRLTLSVSDFGQFGLGPNSIYNLGGRGFRFDGGDNLLYEAGLIVGRNSLQLSSSIRDSQGLYRPSDLRPTEQLTSEWADSDGNLHRSAGMDDSKAAIPMPITVHQDIVRYASNGDDGYIRFEYHLVNRSLEKQTGVRFGFLADFDLSDGADRVKYKPDLDLLYQTGNAGAVVGIMAIDNDIRFSSVANGLTKRGFTAQQKFDLIAAGMAVDSVTSADQMMLVATGPVDIEAGDSVTVRFVLVAGASVSELLANAVRVRLINDLPTSVDDPLASLPRSFALDQNYPNPFNPSTTISFSLKQAAPVRLELFDCLGRMVTVLVDERLGAGRHTLVWNAKQAGGQSAASGVYFYRLTANGESESRKMLLLK